MKKAPILIRWLISSIAISITAYILPGVKVNGGLKVVFLTALVLGLINAILKPIIVFFTLPVTIFTLGFFLLIINAFMVLLANAIVPGFVVDGFWWALLFSVIVSVVGWILGKFAE